MMDARWYLNRESLRERTSWGYSTFGGEKREGRIDGIVGCRWAGKGNPQDLIRHAQSSYSSPPRWRRSLLHHRHATGRYSKASSVFSEEVIFVRPSSPFLNQMLRFPFPFRLPFPLKILFPRVSAPLQILFAAANMRCGLVEASLKSTYLSLSTYSNFFYPAGAPPPGHMNSCAVSAHSHHHHHLAT